VSEWITEAELLTLEHGIDHDPVWFERLSHELRRARAEVARLVENVAQRVGYLKRAEQAEAEVERLRGLIAVGPWDAWRNAEAEVERLREERALQRAKLKEKGLAFNETLLMQGAELTELRAEVERLRGLLTVTRAAQRGEGEK
jgi:hypothetical protein